MKFTTFLFFLFLCASSYGQSTVEYRIDPLVGGELYLVEIVTSKDTATNKPVIMEYPRRFKDTEAVISFCQYLDKEAKLGREKAQSALRGAEIMEQAAEKIRIAVGDKKQ